MINETMYARGAESSIIREIFSYGLERKAQIGAENVFDFSLGNPSVPAPAAVAESIKKALELPSDQLHGYTPAPGLPQCRTAVAESLNRRFGTSYEGKDVFMTVGAAASLTCTLNAITNPGDEVIVIAPYFPEYRVWIEKAGCTCVEALADEDTFQLSVSNVLKAITGARSQFSSNFFACAGYKVIDNLGFETVEAGVEAAMKAGAQIVVLCSSDDEYAEYAPAAYKALAGRAEFVVAGAPECMEDLKAQGIDQFINVKSNVLETLKAFNAKLGIA